jgi:hypothetical protein
MYTIVFAFVSHVHADYIAPIIVDILRRDVMRRHGKPRWAWNPLFCRQEDTGALQHAISFSEHGPRSAGISQDDNLPAPRIYIRRRRRFEKVPTTCPGNVTQSEHTISI